MTSTAEADLSLPGMPFDPDNRVRITDTSKAPWSGTGKIVSRFPTGPRGFTGFVIGDRFVVSTGHTVFAPGYGGWTGQVEFTPGQTDETTKPFAPILASTWRITDGYRRNLFVNEDYSLLILEKDVPADVTRYQLVARDDAALTAAAYVIAGYPGDKTPKASLWCDSGRMTTVEAEMLSYNTISTNRGQSGSAVADFDHAVPEVVGIHRGSISTLAVNRAVRVIDSVIHNIERWRNPS